MAKNVKKRNWAFVLYPESAPKNWREELQKTGLQCAISPLHDKDVNPDGTLKKSHYHVILVYSGPTSYNVVKSLTDGLKQPIPQALEQVRGYYRYLTHKDNPEKAQYDEREISTINGFNIMDFSELTRYEVTQIKMSLQTLIRQRGIQEYAELMEYLQDEEMGVEYEVASNNTLFFDKYITSRRYSRRKLPKVPVCDPETGEVIAYTTVPVENSTETTENSTENSTNSTENSTNSTVCCPMCGSVNVVKSGKTSSNMQRFACKDCGKRFI